MSRLALKVKLQWIARKVRGGGGSGELTSASDEDPGNLDGAKRWCGERYPIWRQDFGDGSRYLRCPWRSSYVMQRRMKRLKYRSEAEMP